MLEKSDFEVFDVSKYVLLVYQRSLTSFKCWLSNQGLKCEIFTQILMTFGHNHQSCFHIYRHVLVFIRVPGVEAGRVWK